MARIYFVEDNVILLNNGLLWLKNEGYDAHGASSYEELTQLMTTQRPDLVLLDWNLPGKDGLFIANELRNTPETKNILIIFVTARNSINDKVSGLDKADAYIAKPFDYRELLATIRALLRRNNIYKVSSSKSTWLHFPQQRILRTPDGQELDITEKENMIIQLFVQHSGKIVSHKMISQVFNESPSLYDKNRTEALLSRLRSKLKTDNKNPIRSFRNQGYQLMTHIKIMNE
ncbi:response regulator transcription factor [Celerinatantimonas diazotrophica]|nr:response regulator transcription factor [Celerinatantimonas diazotrophica]